MIIGVTQEIGDTELQKIASDHPSDTATVHKYVKKVSFFSQLPTLATVLDGSLCNSKYSSWTFFLTIYLKSCFKG